ncbi:PHP domain-like protein [Auricularia subglabra TFB-10046 SS5]|nr:PHP domain-like protein [Auricularia subglabra TFB-10046 SS5]
MFFDLDVPVPEPALAPPPPTTGGKKDKKGKGRAQDEPEAKPAAAAPLLFNAGQIAGIQARIELLAQVGYTVLVLSQTVRAPIEPRSHVNVLKALLPALRPPPGVALATRLTLVLDSDCESGFGLTQANLTLFEPYDILALRPLTLTTFSAACLTHSVPSQLTAHIIQLPLSPRVPYALKHTLIRTARRAGAVFELGCAGAIRCDEGWWASAREVVRVTKGKNVVLTGGGEARGPRDWANIGTMVDLTREQAHDAVSAAVRAVLIRARARKTYRSVLSAPTLIIPGVAPEPNPLKDALSDDGESSSDEDDSDGDPSQPKMKKQKRESARTRKRRRRR